MDSKEGKEKVAPVDAQAAGFLDPSFLRPGTHDAATADLPWEWVGSPTGLCASPGTFSVDLLSDTELLVYRVPKTTRGTSDREARCYADLITGSYLWAGSPATVFDTKRTTQEARRDKIKTREYRRKITVWRLAATQARIKDLEMVTQRCQEHAANPVARGRGMVGRADKYLAQRHGKEPERIPGNVPVLPTFSD